MGSIEPILLVPLHAAKAMLRGSTQQKKRKASDASHVLVQICTLTTSWTIFFLFWAIYCFGLILLFFYILGCLKLIWWFQAIFSVLGYVGC